MPAHPHAALAELLDRFADVSEAAARACQAGDIEMIDQALAARDMLLAQAREAAQLAGDLRFDMAWQERITRVNLASVALREAMSALTDSTRREIEALDRQRAGLARYQAPELTSSVDYRR